VSRPTTYPHEPMSSKSGHAGLTQRLAERAPVRPLKPTKAFSASIRLSAEDLADAIEKTSKLEELARDHGFDLRVYAVGSSQFPDKSTTKGEAHA
jgi:hypothetical protein